eukprot:4846179-Pleurochrysis_carterae.AAC.1
MVVPAHARLRRRAEACGGVFVRPGPSVALARGTRNELEGVDLQVSLDVNCRAKGTAARPRRVDVFVSGPIARRTFDACDWTGRRVLLLAIQSRCGVAERDALC